MRTSADWRKAWEKKSGDQVSDFELDRGTSREQEVEDLLEQELINFIEPRETETLLDAGCGTGVNVLRLHSRVSRVIAFDYAWGSVKRCKKRVQADRIRGAHLCVAGVTAIPLPNHSVDKILCLSVLQYLDDREVSQALGEFARVLTPGGTIILHVKNLSSLYWSTLLFAKRVKVRLGMPTRIEHFRPFRWYVDELSALDCNVVDYNSFNVLYFEGMPRRVLSFIQKFELRYRHSRFWRHPFIRRHGAELKLRARVPSSSAGACPCPGDVHLELNRRRA